MYSLLTNFEIRNVVGAIDYNQELRLSALAETFKQREEFTSVSYTPEENHWLQTRVAPDATYVPFYRSGKCSIVGAESIDHLKQVASRVERVMHSLLEYDCPKSVEVTNIFATANLGAIPPLETVAVVLSLEQTEYEPEQFPAVIYRADRGTALIFASGRVVYTGVTSHSQISDFFDNIEKLITDPLH